MLQKFIKIIGNKTLEKSVEKEKKDSERRQKVQELLKI